MESEKTAEEIIADVERQKAEIENMNCLALCMIVKQDEPEENIKRAVESVLGIAGSAYIVVTYPNPESVNLRYLEELEKNYTVNVMFSEWINNFAETRNIAIDFVRRTNPSVKWILVLDADEELEIEPEFDLISYLQKAHSSIGGFLIEFNHVGNIEKQSDWQCRLFRNQENIYWKGVIHEQVFTQIVNEGLQVPFCKEIKIKHYGYGNLQTFFEKQLRNVSLLLKDAEDNNSVESLFFLARMNFGHGLLQDAEKCISKAVRTVQSDNILAKQIFNLGAKISANLRDFPNCLMRSEMSIASEKNMFTLENETRIDVMPRMLIADISIQQYNYKEAIPYLHQALEAVRKNVPQFDGFFSEQDILQRIQFCNKETHHINKEKSKIITLGGGIN